MEGGALEMVKLDPTTEIMLNTYYIYFSSACMSS